MPYRSSADWDRPVLKRQRDPFLTRIGLMIAGIALLIPVALIVRPQSDGSTRVATDGLPGAVAVVQPGATAASGAGADQTPAAALASSAVPLADAAPATQPAASVHPVAVEAAAQTTSTVTTTTLVETSAPAATAATAASTTAATTTLAPTTTSPPCGKDYEVDAGDAWSAIATAHGVSLGELLAVNRATAATAIYPGDEICLPVGAVRQATTTVAKTTTTVAKTTTTTDESASASETASRAGSTTTTTTTVAPAPSRSYSHAEIEQIIRDVFPDELEERALQVAWRESTYRPGVRNSCCFGLFQINWNSHRSWLDDWGITQASQLYDPTLNAQVALAVYQRAGGWGPWGG